MEIYCIFHFNCLLSGKICKFRWSAWTIVEARQCMPIDAMCAVNCSLPKTFLPFARCPHKSPFSPPTAPPHSSPTRWNLRPAAILMCGNENFLDIRPTRSGTDIILTVAEVQHPSAVIGFYFGWEWQTQMAKFKATALKYQAHFDIFQYLMCCFLHFPKAAYYFC